MLYSVIGGNREKINSLLEKETVSPERFDVFSWDADLVRSSMESVSLFGDEGGDMVFNEILGDEEIAPTFLNFTEAMVISGKKFFLLESALTAEQESYLKEKGAKVIDLRDKTKKWVDKFNPFTLPDAVGRHDAKAAWIEYQRAVFAGGESEELHARIWAKVRDMMTTRTATAEELGIHPFVYKGAKAGIKNWPDDRISQFAEKLVAIYHQSRLGGPDLATALERELLTL